MVADEATQGIDPKGLRRLVVGKFLTTLIVYGADFDKATRAWKDVCGTPNEVISGFNL